MARNRFVLLLLACGLSHTSLGLPSAAQSSEEKPFVLANTAVALPAGCNVKARWVSPPLDPKIVEGASWYSLCLTVDRAGQPWIGYQEESIISPIRQYRFKLPQRYTSLTCMENGGFLVTTEADLCYIVPPQKLETTYENIPTAMYQPIANLPAPKSKLYAAVGNFVYLSAPRERGGSDVYLLKPDGFQGYVKLFTSDSEVQAIAGDGQSTFIAMGNVIAKVSGADGAVTKTYANPREYVRSMAYSPGMGLFYSTNNTVGYVGAKGPRHFMSAPDARIVLHRGTLYVLFPKSGGVLALDNIEDLKRFDRVVKETPVNESADIKITNVRFFEAGEDLPDYASRAYHNRFDHRTARFVYCQIDIENLQYNKRRHKQTFNIECYRKGTDELIQSNDISFDCRTDYSNMWGWVRIGSAEPGALYPRAYTVKAYLNGTLVSESEFVVTGEPDLLKAAAHVDVEGAQKLVGSGADVNVRGATGYTPLMLGVLSGNKDLVKMLLDAGADVNAKADDGNTPLMLDAARYGDSTAIAQMLLAAGADVNIQDPEGQTALHKSLRWDKTSLVKLLLEAGAPPDIKDNAGLTPLLSANLDFSMNHNATAAVIELLLAYGADVEARDADGNTALFNVIGSRNAEAVAILVKHGADVNTKGKLYSTEHSPLGYVLDQYSVFGRYRSDRDNLIRIAGLLQSKGADLIKSEFARAYFRGIDQLLDHQRMIRLLEMSRWAAADYEPTDPSLRKAVVRGLLNATCREIAELKEAYEYYGPLSLCEQARERATKWGLISDAPEISFNLGLIHMQMGNRDSARVWLEDYLDTAPTGSCAARARELMSELQ